MYGEVEGVRDSSVDVSYLQDELDMCLLGTQIVSSLYKNPGLSVSIWAEAVSVKGVGVVRTEKILEKGLDQGGSPDC